MYFNKLLDFIKNDVFVYDELVPSQDFIVGKADTDFAAYSFLYHSEYFTVYACCSII